MSKFGKLGKALPKLDQRVAALHNRTTSLPSFPPSCTWQTGIKYDMLANDQWGDCTCAAVFHMMQTWFDNVSKSAPWQPTDEQVLALYTIVGGWPQKDDGAVETDVLNWWAAHGVPGPDGNPVEIQYMRVDPTQPEWVRYAINEFGGAYIGLALPRSAQAQVSVGGPWDVVSDAPQRLTAAGSWGGHAVNLVGYDADGFTCVTWGDTQYMTNEFFDEYCDEAYAVVSPLWTVPHGLDIASLAADMAKIKAAA